MSATALPWFDLNMWSAWASIAGLIVSLVGLGLSVWVLRRTHAIAEAIRSTEGAIYRRHRLPDRIRKVDDIRKALHTLARGSDASEMVEARELFGRLDAAIVQLREMPDTNIKGCLGKLDTIERTVTKSTLMDLCGQLAELLDHLREYEQQIGILGRGP